MSQNEIPLDYLMSHPLAMEILFYLDREGEKSVSEISNSLGRKAPTISSSLNDMSNIGILKKKEEGRKRIYSISSDELRKSIMNNKLVLDEFRNKLSHLRNPSLYVSSYLEEKLYEYISNNYIVRREYLIKTYLNTMRLDFLIQDNLTRIGILIQNMDAKISNKSYNVVGRIFDIIKGENELNILIIINLIKSSNKSRDYQLFDKWKYDEFLRSFSNDRIKIKSITEFADDKTLLNENFIKYLAEGIRNSILNLQIRR